MVIGVTAGGRMISLGGDGFTASGLFGRRDVLTALRFGASRITASGVRAVERGTGGRGSWWGSMASVGRLDGAIPSWRGRRRAAGRFESIHGLFHPPSEGGTSLREFAPWGSAFRVFVLGGGRVRAILPATPSVTSPQTLRPAFTPWTYGPHRPWISPKLSPCKSRPAPGRPARCTLCTSPPN